MRGWPALARFAPPASRAACSFRFACCPPGGGQPGNCESLLDSPSQVRNTGRSVVGVDLEEKIQQSVSLASPSGPLPDRPSTLYRAGFWRLGVLLARLLPLKGLQTVAQAFA